ncbi:flagellar export chaperone FliS [Microbacterium sp. 77mftsu3.1]|uniref:flagellar export chaperone FliS n=1 Tax=Microbacterium sp. 77mftsu3.1 TaxID=1761802 RepID=UPI00036C6088|nr:flagellar export chaperone FliS [Microbacterium sp. 77mftsu3.1]SDH36795.1 flagellar protein FliS [Microbacterium sp. 77mftsu3.1]
MTNLNPLKAQQRYRENAILSASPERLVTMLYDRLLLDIEQALTAQEAEKWPEATEKLMHAQAIVAELSATLTNDWDGSADLKSLYAHLTATLITANIRKSAEDTRNCRTIVAPLREAFHQAADELAARS